MNKLFALCLLTGCLDSIVDNPCEDGFTLSGDECVVVDPEPTVAPPMAEQPPSTTQPVPPAPESPHVPLPETAEDPVVPCHD